MKLRGTDRDSDIENGNTIYQERCRRFGTMCRRQASKYNVLNACMILAICFTAAFTGSMASFVDIWAGVGFGISTGVLTVLSFFFAWGSKAEMYNGLAVRFEDLSYEPVCMDKFKLYVAQAESGMLNAHIH